MAPQIPLVDLKAQYRALRPHVLAAVERVLEEMHLYLGENVHELEREFAHACDAAEGVGVGSGTDALLLALKACDVGPGDEVITVAHTFFATVEAIVHAGAVPRFVDIEPETMTMDPAQVEAAITPRTRAIVPVHLYGQVADMDAIVAVARRHSLAVIEDACQAHGAMYRGRKAGALGDAGCFSFYYSKNLGAYGEAGMLVTSQPELARRARMLRDHGSLQRYHHEAMGYNARLDELQAAVLRVKLPFLERWNQQRRAIAALYGRALQGAPLRLPQVAPEREHVYHLYVVRTAERDALRHALRERGIETGVHYPVPLHLQPACRAFAPPPGSLPVTEETAAQVLSLPMYPEMEAWQVHAVAEAVQSVLAGGTQERLAA